MPKQQKRGRHLITNYALTKQARELLLTLIANLIDDKNRIPDTGSTRVLPEMIPVSEDDELLNAARTVLRQGLIYSG